MHPVRPTVLVVHDDHETRLDVAQNLTRAGYSCITAADAPSAFWFARHLSFDAAVLDLDATREPLRLATCLREATSPGRVVFTSSRLPGHAAHRSAAMLATDVLAASDRSAVVAAVRRAVAGGDAHTTHAWARAEVMTIVRGRQRLLERAVAGAESAAAAVEALQRTMGRRVAPVLERGRRVAARAADVARALHVGVELTSHIEAAAMLAHAGALALPLPVVLGEATPTEAEREALDGTHARSLALLAQAPALAVAASLVMFTRAHWDGSGTPRGLRGTAIPLGSRIVAVADASVPPAYETAAGERVERHTILARLAGTVLDPELVGVTLLLDAAAC